VEKIGSGTGYAEQKIFKTNLQNSVHDLELPPFILVLHDRLQRVVDSHPWKESKFQRGLPPVLKESSEVGGGGGQG